MENGTTPPKTRTHDPGFKPYKRINKCLNGGDASSVILSEVLETFPPLL